MTDNEIVGEPNLSFHHIKRDSVLLHTQMKTAHSVPRLESSWVTTLCDCDSATKLVKLINLASKEELALALQDVLAIPSIPDIGTVTGIEDAINHGRNLALAEVDQAITNRIGEE